MLAFFGMITALVISERFYCNLRSAHVCCAITGSRVPFALRRMGSKRMRTSDHGPAQAAATCSHAVGATFDVPGAQTSPTGTKRHMEQAQSNGLLMVA